MLGIVVVVFLVILAIGYVGSRGGSGSDDYGYDDYGYGAYDLGYTIAVEDVQDPWSARDGDLEASPGYRLVAVDVIFEASGDNSEAYPTGAYEFKLTDDEGFAYGPLDAGAKPMFPESVMLEPGEKTRGWVTFEVAEGNGLESLSSYDEVVPLSGDVSRAP